MALKTGTSEVDAFFLPDLCRVNAVFLLILSTQLASFLVTLIASPTAYFSWNYLGLVSLFAHWTVLTCAALLCVTRNRLSRIPVRWAVVFCLLLIELVTFFYSLIATRVFELVTASPEWFVARNLIAAGILGGITLHYFNVQHEWRVQKQAELRARLEALQSRIRPHFLFNSLNTIASLIPEDPERAEEALLDLSEIFRMTLRTEQWHIPLREELAFCERYLAIETMRLGNRLQVSWQVDEACLGARVPPLSLQPLLENAVYHGIQNRPEGGEIRVLVEHRQSSCYILISNPCSFEALRDSLAAPHRNEQGNRIALTNTRKRLEALFGESAVLKSSVTEGQYVVTLRFPLALPEVPD